MQEYNPLTSGIQHHVKAIDNNIQLIASTLMVYKETDKMEKVKELQESIKNQLTDVLKDL